LFPEVADVGYCAAKKQYYYGLHGHLMITLDGVITAWTVTSASGDEREALWDLTEGVQGLVMGDKGYIERLSSGGTGDRRHRSANPVAGQHDRSPSPWVVQQLTRTRRLVETVIGQLTEQFH
jgi:hypothetical protein